MWGSSTYFLLLIRRHIILLLLHYQLFLKILLSILKSLKLMWLALQVLHLQTTFYLLHSTISTVKVLVNSTKTITKLIVGTTLVSGLISNPSCIWLRMNILEILTFFPLNSLPYSEPLMEFFDSINSINIIPNPASYFITTSNSSIPYQEAYKFGLAHHCFL